MYSITGILEKSCPQDALRYVKIALFRRIIGILLFYITPSKITLRRYWSKKLKPHIFKSFWGIIHFNSCLTFMIFYMILYFIYAYMIGKLHLDYDVNRELNSYMNFWDYQCFRFICCLNFSFRHLLLTFYIKMVN